MTFHFAKILPQFPVQQIRWGEMGYTLLLNCCVGVHRHMTVKLSELMIKLTLTSCLKGVLKPEIIRQSIPYRHGENTQM